ncbi:MAG: DNA methyltransferase [Pseudomonadota bacterium]
MKVSTWQGCYDGNWNGLIVPEAFSHPAKFAPGLIRRIYQHCLEQGYVRKGETIVDPFGGIGAGGIMAAYAGLSWIGVELETKFVTLAIENFEMHKYPCSRMGYPQPAIIQGDSRRLSQVLQEADLIATSPPFVDCLHQTEGGMLTPHQRADHGRNENAASVLARDYGTTPGQIGGMKAGDVGAVVTSPPYEGTELQGGPTKDGQGYTGGKRCFNEYGITDGQIGAEKSESYWQAVADVYRECWKILKPGGVIVVVLKSYIKQGRRVPLPMQTLKLLIHLGFEPLERIKAMLVKETVTAGLFGDVRKVKERKSFFRRLAESKGSPAIDWEEALICRKP